MAAKPKVFISYSTRDRSVAERLYRDLVAAGAEAFEFERSAKPGSSAWNDLLRWIESADVFILIVSKNALKSRPVRAEIEFAHHQHVNGERPYALIPAILEDGLRLPRELRTKTELSLADYTAGVTRLIDELGLQVTAVDTTPGEARAQTGRRAGAAWAAQGGGGPDRLELRSRLSNSSSRLDSKQIEQLKSMAIGLGKAQSTNAVQEEQGNGGLWRELAGNLGAILGIGAVATVLGAMLNKVLLGGHITVLDEVTGAVATMSRNWGWFSWATALGMLVLIIRIAWFLADDEIPVDAADYAVISFKSAGLALILTSVWSILFSSASLAGALQILIPISSGVTTATIVIYLFMDEF